MDMNKKNPTQRSENKQSKQKVYPSVDVSEASRGQSFEKRSDESLEGKKPDMLVEGCALAIGADVEVIILDSYPVVSSGLQEWFSKDLPGACVRVVRSVDAIGNVEASAVRRVWVVEVVDERGEASWAELDRLSAGGGLVVVFSRSSEPEIVHEAIRRGATSYVHKSELRDALKSAVLRAASGHLFVSEAAAPRFLEQIRSRSSRGALLEPSLQGVGLLTGREREVMKWLGQACSTRRIAFKLGVSAKTVEAHAANIRGKLHLRSMRELLRAAALLRGEESSVVGRGGVDGADEVPTQLAGELSNKAPNQARVELSCDGK